MNKIEAAQHRIAIGHPQLGDFNTANLNGRGAGAIEAKYDCASDLALEQINVSEEIAALNEVIYTAADEGTEEALMVGLIAQYKRDELMAEALPTYEKGKHLSVREYLQKCAKELSQAGEAGIVPEDITEAVIAEIVAEAEDIIAQTKSELAQVS